MARTRSEPWKSFADWLTAHRGLNPASVSTYLTQVRRMLGEITPLTSEGLTAWVDGLPAHHRSPHRTAWRCYVGWRASEGEEVADLVVLDPVVDVPPEVVDAIASLLSVSRLKPRDLAGMTWAMRAVNDTRDRAFPDKVFFKAPITVDADLVLMPREALQVIGSWLGLIDAEPSAPLLPRSPSEPLVPMAATTMQRLIRERRRAVNA